jgi:gliding motility-associated-like protein
MYYFSQRTLLSVVFLCVIILVSVKVYGEGEKQLSIPLVFRENVGQWEEDILFKGSSSSSNIFFTKEGMRIAHTRRVKIIQPGKEDELENLYWKINFLGALNNVKVKAAAAAASYTNYLIGTEDKHRTNVRDYNELRYESLYKGIDLHYYTSKGELKYDFILAPGANIDDIKLQCEGIKKIHLNKKGELEIAHRWGTVLEKKPYSYQEINGEKIEVDIRYEIKEGTTYGYRLYGQYDRSKKIVIDPLSIVWGTYVGGANSTVSGYQYDIAVDANGGTYGTGYYPASFPATGNAFDNSFNGGFGDVFVYKMNENGSNLEYATYVGGSDDDRGMAIAVNANGEAYVAGYTFTPPNGFPKTVQFGGTASTSNAFAFKLNSSGSGLIYSAYFGANDQEAALDIAINSLGEAVIVGETKSYNFPMAAVSYDNTYNGAPYDGFFVKLNASGSAMLSSGFLGGLRDDRAKGVAIDQNDNVYITGYTGSNNFPVSSGAYDNSHNGGLDVFVMKFNATMTTPQYSTYLGGTYDEEGVSIGVNDDMKVAVTGYTFSPNFPSTNGSYQGLKDIIVFELNAAGSALEFSKIIGTSRNEEGTSVLIDNSEKVLVAGIETGQEYDAFLRVVCRDGAMIERRISIAGSHDDYKYPKIAIWDKRKFCGEVMLGLTSHSTDLPTSAGVYQQQKANGDHTNDQPALFKLRLKASDSIFFDPNPVRLNVCANSPDSITLCAFTGNDRVLDDDRCADMEFLWDHKLGSNPKGKTSNCVKVLPSEIGGELITVEVTKGCSHGERTFGLAGVGAVVWLDTLYKVCDQPGKFISVMGGVYKYSWSTGDTTVGIYVTTSGIYTVTVFRPCDTVSLQTRVEIMNSPIVNLGQDRTFCFPASIPLVAVNAADTIPTTYQWTPGGQTSPTIMVSQPDTFCVTKRNECGRTSDCVIINEAPDPVANLGRDTSLCNGNPITLNPGNSPGATYLWSPDGQTTQTIQVTTPGTYSVTVTNSCGSASDAINVTLVATPPLVNLGADLLLCSPSDFPRVLDAGNSGSNYYWSTGATSQTISVSAGGEYFVTVTNGCGQDRDTLSITAPPGLGLDLGPDTVLCGPATITLNAGNPGATYLWTPGGQTTRTKIVTASGNYSVTVTNACGTASDNINITIQNGSPSVNLGPDRTICPGTPTVLNAGSSAGQTYLWSTGVTTSTISVSTPSIYWVDVTNSCGTVRDSIRILNGMPSFSLGPDRYVCAPSTVSLSAAGAGTSFVWSTGSTASSIVASATGIYWVDVTNSCGTLRDSVFVSVMAAVPVVNLGPDQVQCASFSTILNAGNPGSTYLWSPGGQTSQSITVTTGGIYSVTVTNGCGVAQDNILITTQPMTSLGPDINICQGTTTMLDAGNPGASYAWTPGGQTTQTIQVSTGGTYGVTVTNACGSISDDIVVTILTAAPIVNLGPDQRACAPVSILLDASNPGTTYSWSTGATSQTINVNSTGTYSVRVNNSCGVDEDTISIIVDAGIPAVNLGADQSFCNPVFYILDAGAGAATYSWNTGASSPTIFVTSAGNYSVTATNSCGNASDNVTITAANPAIIALKDTGGCINPILLDAGNPGESYFWSPGGQTTQTIMASVTGQYAVTISNACGIFSKSVDVVINTGVPTVALGADTNLCNPSGLLLNAGIQPGGTYLWSPGGDTTQTKRVTQSGNYSVSVTNYCGTSSDNINIAANPVAIDARFEDTICINTSVRLYTDSLPGYTYNWFPSNELINATTPSPSASPSATTEYFVTTSDGICFNIDSVTIHVDNPIQPDIDIFPPGREGFVPLEIIFKDRNNIGVSYIWDFDDGSISDQINPTHKFTTENYFDISVIAITVNGCRAYDTIQIKTFTLYIPNLITPNGDGKNDTWELTKLHDELFVEIYNRWGDRVYRHDHYINEWGGENLSDGVYYYLVEDRKFGKKYKGWVQILRDGDTMK